MARRVPSDTDRVEALTTLLGCLRHGHDIIECVESLRHLHPKNDTFPGEVFMVLGAQALDAAEVSADNPIKYEGLTQHHLPECEFSHSHADKFRTAVLFSASLHGGLEPDLLNDVAWWRSDDYWRYAALAATALIRACAHQQAIPVATLAERLADQNNLELQ